MGLGIVHNMNTLGFGAGNVMPFKSDLAFYAKNRSGLTLIDEIGSNHASILLPYVSSIAGTAPHHHIETNYECLENTVFVAKMSFSNILSNNWEGAGKFMIGISMVGTAKYGIYWGNNFFASTINADTDFHTFIFYNKKLWVRPINTDISDANILNIINTVTPDINAITATWASSVITYKIGAYSALTIAVPGNRIITKLGTITANVITWAREIVQINKYCGYDILNDVKYNYITSGGLIPTTSRNSIKYSATGYTDILNVGHTLCYNASEGLISMPYSKSGIPLTTAAPINFVKIRNIITNPFHNVCDSSVRFPLGSIYDRSSTTVFEDLARAATTYYDVTNPTDWHITELNRLLLSSWLKADYKGIIFPHGNPNSLDIEEMLSLTEIFSYSTNKTVTDFTKVLKYTGDTEAEI